MVSGIRMSSAVPSFLSGPALVTVVSSSSQMILNGLSHASVIFEAVSPYGLFHRPHRQALRRSPLGQRLLEGAVG